MRSTPALSVAVFALAALTSGCESQPASATSNGNTAPAASEAAPAPEPTGRVVEVAMITDGEGNYFEPATIEATPGDVIRFTLQSGVHNVSFPAGDNLDADRVPEASPYLQLPGQTWDLLVDLDAGTYTFQCDPHAVLGMVGTLTVD